ncbi:hypothetical protein ACV242_000997 [Peribacillus simplex]
MEVRRLEATIDQDFANLQFWNVNQDTALIIACQFFEDATYQFDQLVKGEVDATKKLFYQQRILDLMQALEWLIKMIYKNCPESTGDNFNDEEELLVNITSEAFDKSIMHSKAEQIFMPYTQGLYTANVLTSEDGDKYLEFLFPSKEFGILEGINSVLLDEQNRYKMKKYEKADMTFSRLFGNIPEAVYNSRSIAKVEFDFDFPDDYKIGPYTIAQIKEVWYKVIREAWWGDRENQILKSNSNNFPDIFDLKIEEWNFETIDRETTFKIINDLTFTGKKKGKQRYTTPITEPIFELKDGRKIISPRFILNNQPARNILSSLNRIYGDDASIDADMKEIIFIDELSKITKNYDNLLVCHNVPVEGTNIDFGIYDKNTKAISLFEIKWFVEPVTAVEIKSKDKEIKKGLHEQLPKYKKALIENIEEFTKKAFKETLEVKESFFFVLTRVSIGSGLIPKSSYLTINIRMLKKALFESKGNLFEACKSLNNKEYYPVENTDYILELESGRLGSIRVDVDSIRKLPLKFDLTITEDEKVELFGHIMDPHSVPQNQFVQVGPSQYQLKLKNRQSTQKPKLNREQRRKLERESRRSK